MVNNKEINKMEIPFFSCGVEYEGKIYIASAQNNDLYEYDCSTNELRCILFLKKKKIWNTYIEPASFIKKKHGLFHIWPKI